MSNKAAAYRFRNELLCMLHEQGWRSAVRPPERKGLPDKPVQGSILGLPATVTVRSRIHVLLSEAVDDAKRKAAAEGNELFFTVQARRDAPSLEDSFVLTDVATWLKVMRQLYPDQVSPIDLAQSA